MDTTSRRAFLWSAAATLSAASLGTTVLGQDQDTPQDKAALTGARHPLVIPGYYGKRPGIQLGTQLPATASDDDMRFTQQLGAEWVMTSLPPEQHTLENYQRLKNKFAAL